MRARHGIGTLVVAATLAVGEAGAQAPSERPLVRLRAPSVGPDRIEGWAERVGDTLFVSMDGGARVRVPVASITDFETRVGRSRGRGAIRGLVVGGVIGGLTGVIVPLDDCGPDGTDPEKICTRTEAVGFSTLGGVVTGAVIGAFFPRAVWRDVAPTAVTLVPGAWDGRLALRGTVRVTR